WTIPRIMNELWHSCLSRLEGELSQQEMHTWLRPLQVVDDSPTMRLLAPNAYPRELARGRYSQQIASVLQGLAGHNVPIQLEVGSLQGADPAAQPATSAARPVPANAVPAEAPAQNLDHAYTFDSFVEGKPNQLGKAAATQVAMNPGH